MRQRVESSLATETREREHVRAVLAGRAGVSAAQLTGADLDAPHAASPYRNRKSWLHHLHAAQVARALAECSLLRTCTVLSLPEEPPALPPYNDARACARFAARQVGKPFVRTLALSSVQRGLERLAEEHLSGSSDVERGRWTRGAWEVGLGGRCCGCGG